MSTSIRTIAFAAAACAASLAALAQTAPVQTARPTEGASYNSAFKAYRPFNAEEVGDWRKANDTVREIGGWRVYAREIQEASQGLAPSPGAVVPGHPASAAPSAAPKSVAAPAQPAHHHGGHKP